MTAVTSMVIDFVIPWHNIENDFRGNVGDDQEDHTWIIHRSVASVQTALRKFVKTECGQLLAVAFGNGGVASEIAKPSCHRARKTMAAVC